MKISIREKDHPKIHHHKVTHRPTCQQSQAGQASKQTYAGVSVVNRAEDKPEDDNAGGDLRNHHSHAGWHESHRCMYNLRTVNTHLNK